MVRVRGAVESLYIGACSVYEYKRFYDEKSHSYKHKEVLVYKDLPCRLSFSTRQSYTGLRTSEEKELGNRSKHWVKLFMAPELQIKPGSKIVVTQNGRQTVYKNSGITSVFKTHQEIIVETWDKWF